MWGGGKWSPPTRNTSALWVDFEEITRNKLDLKEKEQAYGLDKKDKPDRGCEDQAQQGTSIIPEKSLGAHVAPLVRRRGELDLSV